MTNHDQSKRQFIKTAAYAAPVILTMSATPAFAKTGSGRPCNKRAHFDNGVGNGPEGGNPGRSPNNDEVFTQGFPGRRHSGR